jgi:predicted RNA-binding protein
MQYWICNTTPENWLLCLSDLSYGVPETDSLRKKVYGLDQISQVKIGDGVFIYSSKTSGGLMGYFTVNSEMYEDRNRIWVDKLYPYRIKLAEKNVLSSPIPFAEIKGRIHNKKTGVLISDGASLLGKSMIPIFPADAEYLLTLVDKNQLSI